MTIRNDQVDKPPALLRWWLIRLLTFISAKSQCLASDKAR